MLLVLLLAAAAPQNAIEAERAFAADAKSLGQWTAFRKWATDDAVMFVPQAINAQAFLKPLKDPVKPVEWWPTESYVSCDGRTAANVGGWRRPDGSVGYFTTIWQRQPGGGWKWTVDHADAAGAERMRRAKPQVVRATCTGRARAPVVVAADAESRSGQSGDATLIWRWTAARDLRRTVSVSLWDGRKHASVIDDAVAAPPKTDK